MLRLGQTLCQLQKTVLNQWLKLLTACKQLCDPWFGGEIQCFCRRMATAGQGAREKLNQINDLVVSLISDVFVVPSVVLVVSGGECARFQQPAEHRAGGGGGLLVLGAARGRPGGVGGARAPAPPSLPPPSGGPPPPPPPPTPWGA